MFTRILFKCRSGSNVDTAKNNPDTEKDNATGSRNVERAGINEKKMRLPFIHFFTVWIWDVVRLDFGEVREWLDVYHALEHLSGIGKLFYGEESSASRDGCLQTAEKMMAFRLRLMQTAVCFRSSDWEWSGGGCV